MTKTQEKVIDGVIVGSDGKQISTERAAAAPAISEQQSYAGNMMSMIERVAVNPDADISKMERLWEMHKEAMDRDAKAAYNRAMADCQAEMPAVPKDAWNDQTKSHYSRLETIVKVAKPIYTKHGFSLSFGEGKSDEGFVLVTCDVSHAGGDTRHFWYNSPVDDRGIAGKVNKTPTHGKASAVTYGQRYITKLIFNLQLGGEDDDGNAAGGTVKDSETLSDDQLNAIDAKIRENDLDQALFKRLINEKFGTSDLSEVPARFYQPLMARIDKAIARKNSQ